MERTRDRFTTCIGCGCLSFEECAPVNPGDELASRGPGTHLLDAEPHSGVPRRPPASHPQCSGGEIVCGEAESGFRHEHRRGSADARVLALGRCHCRPPGLAEVRASPG
ncbi:hypothetical protein K1W54_17705 [Micromonospora sp. CPCC 205371]|nr:hypothetical protein [Micromonospora sp. CPCC 205371]